MYRMTASSTHGALYSSGRRSDFRLVLPSPRATTMSLACAATTVLTKSNGDCENPSKKALLAARSAIFRHPRRDPRVARLHVPIPPEPLHERVVFRPARG